MIVHFFIETWTCLTITRWKSSTLSLTIATITAMVKIWLLYICGSNSNLLWRQPFYHSNICALNNVLMKLWIQYYLPSCLYLSLLLILNELDSIILFVYLLINFLVCPQQCKLFKWYFRRCSIWMLVPLIEPFVVIVHGIIPLPILLTAILYVIVQMETTPYAMSLKCMISS